MDPDTLKAYHPDLSDHETKKAVDVFFDGCENLMEGGIWFTRSNITGHLASTLIVGFDSVDWNKGEEKDRIELRDLTNWDPAYVIWISKGY
jgi:hypothetical protein